MENTDKEDYLSSMVLQPQNNPVLSEPRLEKPGAGLPLGGRILELVKKIPHDWLETKILVPPMQGLEDSSRFWSM